MFLRKKKNKPKDQNNEMKSKIEKQMYLAKESPDSIYDLSDCALEEIPSEVYPFCKILQKETLLLNNNNLRSLGYNLKNLKTIKFLDFHGNQLYQVPHDINEMSSLLNLDLSQNILQKLPPEFSQLSNLQILDISANDFETFPDVITKLVNLQSLNIRKNEISSLPTSLIHLLNLQHFFFDLHLIQFPSPDICEKGLPEIMKYLKEKANEKGCKSNFSHSSAQSFPSLVSPSLHLGSPSSFNATSTHLNVSSSYSNLEKSLSKYEQEKEIKKNEKLKKEKMIEEYKKEQFLLTFQANNNKNKLISFIAQENLNYHKKINDVQKQKLQERDELIKKLYHVEDTTSNLIKELLQSNEKIKKTEMLIDQMEKENLEKENWYLGKSEEYFELKKKEIADSFSSLLEKTEKTDQRLNDYFKQRQIIASLSIKDVNEYHEALESKFTFNQDQKKQIIDILLNEEKVQKEAYELLQTNKDMCRKRINQQIEMVEKQLIELSLIEINKKNIKFNQNIDFLVSNRERLMQLLKGLFIEKEEREKELKKRILELEKQNENDQKNYWLIQYQRLLQAKNGVVYEEDNKLEVKVLDILNMSGAGEFKTLFASKGITLDKIIHMKNQDFEKLGVSNCNVRQAILESIESFKGSLDKNNKISIADDTNPLKDPSSSSSSSSSLLPSSSSQFPEIKETTIKHECVICLSEEANTLFSSCGHICVCFGCSKELLECPLDRVPIENKIKIFLS